MKFFDEAEFNCSCCGENKMDDSFLEKLETARRIANTPFIISSGYRCEKNNRFVGGKPKSSHLKGRAADIVVRGSRERFQILHGLVAAGFHRIGVSKSFIHVDDDETKDRHVLWTY